MMEEPVPAESLLELHDIVKTFPAVLANDRVNLRLRRGDIHALLGENGAGKSTLVKIIYGVLSPDSGRICWQGAVRGIPNPAVARALGIGMVFQHFSLFEALSVEENIALALDAAGMARRFGGQDLEARIAEVSRAYGLELDPQRMVYTLSVGERQRIEIVRCLLQEPKLLIMDEPTSVLTPQEARMLFETLRKLAAEGCAILYISHRLEEIRQLCHSATIMRAGRVVATCDPARETAQSLAQMMMGSTLSAARRPHVSGSEEWGSVCLQAEGICLPGFERAQHRGGYESTGLRVHRGEILGVAGLAGNGQEALLAALSGEQPPPRGRVCFGEEDITGWSVARRRVAGMHFVPEERLGHGAVPGMSLRDNVAISARERQGLVRDFGFLDHGRMADFAAQVVERFAVRCAGTHAPAESLSGGNVQKFIIGREVAQQPRLLVASQPTWGVDAGAAAAIHKELIALAEQGSAVIIISQDLDELFALCDRIAVICEGVLSAAYPRAELDPQKVGLLMAGTHTLPA